MVCKLITTVLCGLLSIANVNRYGRKDTGIIMCRWRCTTSCCTTFTWSRNRISCSQVSCLYFIWLCGCSFMCFLLEQRINFRSILFKALQAWIKFNLKKKSMNLLVSFNNVKKFIGVSYRHVKSTKTDLHDALDIIFHQIPPLPAWDQIHTPRRMSNLFRLTF